MLSKTFHRIERVLLNDAVDRCVRAMKLALTGGTVSYAIWRSLDHPRCGAPITACVLFASLSTLVGLVALFTFTEGDEGG